MNDGYEVVGPEVVAHARRLGQLADEMRDALDTARQVRMTGGAYGVPGWALAGLIDRLGESGQSTLRAGLEAIGFADRQLRGGVTDYDATDGAGARSFEGGETV